MLYEQGLQTDGENYFERVEEGEINLFLPAKPKTKRTHAQACIRLSSFRLRAKIPHELKPGLITFSHRFAYNHKNTDIVADLS